MRIHPNLQLAVIVIFLLSATWLLTGSILEEYQFPYKDRTCDDFSSAFGPRDYGTDHYDFHAAVDIGRYEKNAANLIISYELAFVQKVTETQITLWYGEDSYEELVQCNHVEPNDYVKEKYKKGEWVAAGDILGKIQSSQAHLDFRYFPDTDEEGFQDEYASHPGEVLEGFDGEESGPTFIVDGKDFSQETAYFQLVARLRPGNASLFRNVKTICRAKLCLA